MTSDILPVGDRLDRIRALLSGSSGPLGNGEMHAWANLGDAARMPRDVFDLIEGLGVLERWYPNVSVNVPESSAELADRLAEIDGDGAVHRLIGIASTTLAYGSRGRYDRVKAAEVFGSLVRLLGHGSRWWSNTDGTGGWNPVTRHVFDTMVIGVGSGVVVTILVFDED
ncbi:hypothetical protein OH799_23450 [Nocardia sp. NBC_00881]|uniref:hypothetical protein n=1 Tax=Nocardia sp. NBC_00881 TaxID=2975995 RepID=UPI00386A0039|nr:hypothetical protein OH799_23450 [Nocardia sp. NBC_00881]